MSRSIISGRYLTPSMLEPGKGICAGFRVLGCNDGDVPAPRGPANPLDTVYWTQEPQTGRPDICPMRAPQDTEAIRQLIREGG